MPPYVRKIIRHDHEGEAIIYITPAKINDIDCFAVRNKLAEEGKGRHANTIIELIASKNLRSALALQDGDKVTISF